MLVCQADLIPTFFAYRSKNVTESKLPTHKNLRDRIAAFQRLNQQNNSPSTSPNLSVSSSPDPSLTATHPNTSANNNNTKGSFRDRIARFEAAGGGIPIPKGSFGMGAVPLHDDEISRRKGEMLGNRVPGLNRPKALPTEGLGMVSKSHLTVKPVAKDQTYYHGRKESQSLGSHHRRYTSQSYSALTSPTLSAYDREGEASLLEVDEFGGLNGLSSPQTPSSPYSLIPTFSSPTSPEVSAIDKLPGKVVIPDKFQRRVVSDYQASYGVAKVLTPDPEMSLQPLEEEVPSSSANRDSCSRLEAEPTPDPQTHDDSEFEVQPPAERTPELLISTHEVHLPPPIDSPREVATETTPQPTSKPITTVDVIEVDAGVEDDQRSSEVVPPTQDQDHDPTQEVSKPNPISIPFPSAMDSADVSPPASPKVSTLSTVTSTTSSPLVIMEDEPSSGPVEEVPSAGPTRNSDITPTPDEVSASPTLVILQLPVDEFPVGDASQLQTPPESPEPAFSVSTAGSDLSDSTIDYQSGPNHPDLDRDLFVLPLPKDDELPPQSAIQEVAVARSIHQVPVSPLPAPIDFPITTDGIVSTGSSDTTISFARDNSLALDASQTEIAVVQSEVTRPASPTFPVATPFPPTATRFRTQTPPPPEELFPSPDKVDNTRVSPPRIRKKLYANYSVPTSFKDTLSPPPTQRSFSAVVHQKTRSSAYAIPPGGKNSLAPDSSRPVNAFMTPKKKRSSFVEPMVSASPGSELVFLVKNAAILEAQLQHGVNSSGDEGRDKLDSAQQSNSSFMESPPRSTLRPEMTKVKSASTPTLVSSSVATSDHIPPVPDLIYDHRNSNSGLPSNRHIPPFLPQLRSRKSGAHEEADRKSLAPSHKSRKSEKSPREKDKDSMPRARKLSSRLRSLASSSTNSLRSLGRPSLSSETSVSFDGSATVSIEPMTPQDTGNGGNGKLRVGIGSPGSRSQISQGSGSEWNSLPRRRDMLGRASSFADRLLSRAGKTKLGGLDNSSGNAPDHHRTSIGS